MFPHTCCANIELFVPVQLVEERSPLMKEDLEEEEVVVDGGAEVVGEGERALVVASRKKKKGLTWGCVNSWLLRKGSLFI